MEQKLFTELRPLYTTSKERPNEIRIRIRMRDLIAPDVLRHAVDTTMERYPYFCVELQKKDGQYIFAENHRPVVITNSLHGVALNSEASNYHMIAFCWQDNWIILDVFHGMTDGTGAYEVVRTLLYYYCSERYDVRLKEEGIRLAGDEISEEEWSDPVVNRTDLPIPPRTELSNAFSLSASAGLEKDDRHTVFSIAISESEFMRFNLDNDGSPGTMVSLLLSRAIAKLFPTTENAIRIALCVNQRKALNAPLSHQSLVGGVMLEYKEKMRDWPLDRQATAYRGMVFAQSQEENVLMGVASTSGICRMILSKDSDQERQGIAGYINDLASRIVTATVSYVGKANYREAEKYIRDFRLWTSPSSNDLLIEISAVNGRFTLDFIQRFSSPIYVNAFLKELEENGIVYDLQDVNELELANAAIARYGRDYLSICMLFSLGQMGQWVFDRFVIASGKSHLFLFTLSAASITNLILDPVFIIGFGMGTRGAAIATVIGQFMGLFAGIYINLRWNREIEFSFTLRPDWQSVRTILRVGIPSTLVQVLTSFVTVAMNSILLAFSSTAVAVYGVCCRMMNLCTVGVHGIDNGLIPIVAYNYGARKPERVRESLRWAMGYSALFFLPFLLVLEFAPRWVLRLFNASEHMMGIGIPAVRILALAWIISIPNLVIAAALQGLSQPRQSMVLTLLWQAILPVLLALVFRHFGNLNLIWLAFVLAEAIGIPAAMMLWRSGSGATLAGLLETA